MVLTLPAIFVQTKQGANQSSGEFQASLIEPKPIIFVFTPSFQRLSSLNIYIKNPGLLNNSIINVNITDSLEERDVTFSGSNVGDPSTVPIKFTPFNNSSLSPFTVTITTDNNMHDGLYILTNKEGVPQYDTYYQETNLLNKYKSNINTQLNRFYIRDPLYNIGYLTAILLLIISYLVL